MWGRRTYVSGVRYVRYATHYTLHDEHMSACELSARVRRGLDWAMGRGIFYSISTIALLYLLLFGSENVFNQCLPPSMVRVVVVQD